MNAKNQAHFWKRLRQIKKCVFCRNRFQCLHTIQLYLMKISSNSKINPDRFYLRGIENKINQSNAKLTYQYIKQDDKLQFISLKYHKYEDSQKQMKQLVVYYRYYEHKPISYPATVFNTLMKYQNDKKMIKYNHINQLYNPQITTLAQTKGKIQLSPVEPLLKGLFKKHSETKQTKKQIQFNQWQYFDDTSLTTVKGYEKNKKIQEIDREFSLKSKGKKGKKSNHTKLQAFETTKRHSLKSQSKRKIRTQQHKSCFQIYSNMQNFHTNSSMKMKEKKQKGKKNKSKQVLLKLHNQTPSNQNQFKLYISKLKQKINKQKMILNEELPINSAKSNKQRSKKCQFNRRKQTKNKVKVKRKENKNKSSTANYP